MSEMHPYILIVEANEDNRYLLHSAFAKSGLSAPLKFIDSGELALKYLQQLSSSFFPSLIVLDMNMPGLNGHEVMSLIHKDEVMKKIPVLFYSSSMKPVVKELLLTLGATGCFEKHIEITQLIESATYYVEMANSESR